MSIDSDIESKYDWQGQTLIHDGKAKEVYSANEPGYAIIHYKDDASAYNGIKRAQIANKGILNNKISSIIYERLEAAGIRTHFIKRINDRDQLCYLLDIIPIEFIARNIAAGTMARRLGLEEGCILKTPVYELCYKNDELDDPIINEDHAVALGLSTYREVRMGLELTKHINLFLKDLFAKIGITLVDFKIEFGRSKNGELILSDELSPDTCRLWDAKTSERLDKDRFRRDLGRVGEAYEEILRRLSNNTEQE